MDLPLICRCLLRTRLSGSPMHRTRGGPFSGNHGPDWTGTLKSWRIDQGGIARENRCARDHVQMYSLMPVRRPVCSARRSMSSAD